MTSVIRCPHYKLKQSILNMNNTWIWVVIVVVLAVGGYWLWSEKYSGDAMMEETTETTGDAAAAAAAVDAMVEAGAETDAAAQ